MGPIGNRRSIAGVYYTPDAAVCSVDAFGVGLGILVAGIFVIPIGDPHCAVGADLFADGTEPAVGGGEEIFFGGGFEAGAVGDEAVVVDGALVDVAEENVALVFGREHVALIDADAAVGGHVVFVVDDGWEEFVAVGIFGDAALALVDAAGSEVPEMINDAGADESVAGGVEVDAPWIAGAVGEDFEFFGDGMIAAKGGADFDAG